MPLGPLNRLAEICGRQSHDRWWKDLDTGEEIERNHGELFMLVVSELAEAMEADRVGSMDKHLPHRPGVEVELADAMIRIFDMAWHWGIDLDSVVREKIAYNQMRADHQKEARLAPGGKRY